MVTKFEDIEKFKLNFEGQTKFVVTDQGGLIQIMNKNVSKETGILELCKHFGIDSNHVMAFGYDYNDMEMFKLVDIQLQCLNAEEELIDFADEVTDTNENDGVAKVLELIT